MFEREVAVAGVGLHSGAPVRVILRRREGPVVLGGRGREARMDEFVVASTERATTVEACGGRLRVGTVEHALGALAGLGIRTGVGVHVEGAEMPLLDGGARTWCEALARIGLPEGSAGPRLRVARPGVVDVGASRYTFEAGPEVDVRVRFESNDARIWPDACWGGDPEDFRRRIAPARTFAFTHDLEDLARRGLARHADPEAVVLLAPDAIHCTRPFEPDEPARHKLLDLLGDAYLHGGPPVGQLYAVRPGHAANAVAFARARAEGIVIELEPT